ncbi:MULTISPECIES: hypothetical protein [Bradyrhizobium]|jgi:hypothetical protein|uniref:Uncharacterized protein n=1 Tax=Bradyrhizobium elkanii TaxID=29448 RepID=A0A8I2C515_BRAEL|nr:MULTISPECIES: hypothetical protein [Bradyrhizobium]MBP1293662.1 hypothetical protein [Bradyrhizobium elkanii]MCP1925755.1 hypothetical protein [Bradyrhizobium elkanii]MCS3451389.1 hypothetical protein [Bradyrhizobium elkanii]MCS3476754.1 hypothetical protein [Bradyrhizobium elkanii]MCS3566586.1 hypothetical protein [Bradyrhizobium elkanii]
MGLFKRNESWEHTFPLTSRYGAFRGILAVLFWLWGIPGLLFNASTLFGLTGNMGVETSAHSTATCLVWIGGMVLFGNGALLAHPDFDGERPMQEDYGDMRVDAVEN